MGVLLQAFYQMGSNGIPLPPSGGMTTSWWNHLASQANALRQAGFTAIWLPPPLKGASGKASVGYDVFDDYDIGSKLQKNTTETRYGSREELVRCVAIMRSNGLDVYADIVENQRSGGSGPGGFTFRYSGANGVEGKGRFPKDAIDFHPTVPEDPNVPGPDFSFGSDLAPINGGNPKGSVAEKLIESADWLTRSLDLQGYRLDDVKGQSSDFLRRFLGSKSMAGKFAVAEYFDSNISKVQDWLFNKMGGVASTFDFSTRFTLAAMCDSRPFNMATLDHTGLAGQNPFQAVTFVENHDTDRSEPIIQNKILAYAYILTSEGYPSVFYKDYSTDPGCFGLKPEIDNLIWIHEALASGGTQQRWKDFDVFAYERMGGPHLLVALNNDPTESKMIRVDTGFGPNVVLHDYTGHGADVRTDATGAVTLTVPRNVNGNSYICYSLPRQNGAVAPATRAVTQDIEGAADLDVPPCSGGGTVAAGRIWCAANSPIEVVLTPDMTGWTGATEIALELLSPDGTVRASQAFTSTSSTPSGSPLRTTAQTEGFHTVRLTASNTPATNPNPPYKVSVTYTAPQTLVVAAASSNIVGEWSAPIALANVPIHTHLLPTGKVLFWGRRRQPTDNSFASLNEWETHSFLLDLQTLKCTATANRPVDKNGKSINLFCSSHTFLPDGRLIVVGGHLFDSQGIDCTSIYDPTKDLWTAVEPMQGQTLTENADSLWKNGRWYPTAITLADGSVFVCGGSFATSPPAPLPKPPGTASNNTPEIWNQAPWKQLTPFDDQTERQQVLFPRLHLAPDGRVFMSGANRDCFFFDTTGKGNWTQSASRPLDRDYAPSVMYDVGKIVFIGGGNDPGTHLPTNVVEIIDLTANPPIWKALSPTMHFRRRQHNATLLPDGTVLVTGGSQGGGGLGGQGFNDLTKGEPIRAAELWDPRSDTWTILAEEQFDRCYHSTAILLPDGRVLSGGGGEYQPVGSVLASNDKDDSHLNAQIFSPPYLFKGPRPQIQHAPEEITYAQTFQVATPNAAEIASASLVRLSSVTHSFNTNQRINFLAPTAGADFVTLTAPANANSCPPGHYFLFLLNNAGVPSIGRVIRVQGQHAVQARVSVEVVNQVTKNSAIIANATRPEVVVGLTATCPYGLGACWGGAFAGLKQLDGVKLVRPIADNNASVAFLYLDHDGLPDIANWPSQFQRSANGSYLWRGVEITVHGVIQIEGGSMILPADAVRPAVLLAPLVLADKVQLEQVNGIRLPLPADEEAAYSNLAARAATGEAVWWITGPIKQTHAGFILEVRKFH